jgi:hypothetical protein
MANKEAAKKGLLFGFLAHLPCILIILITIVGISLGATTLSIFLNTYLFYGLILLSLIATIIAAIIYLKKNKSLSLKGIKKNWKYLTILFGIVIIINVLFLTVVFPLATNMAFNNKTTDENLSNLSILVDIPCSGHAYLINSELTKNPGIKNIGYDYPKLFTIFYDSKLTNKEEIYSNPVFKEYKILTK